MKFRLLALILALPFPTMTHAEQRPAFVGSYSFQGHCAPEYQCALEIAPERKGAVLATFIIADRIEWKDIKKAIPLYLRNTQDGRLVAGLAGYVIEITRQPNGDVIVSGLPERNGVMLAGTYKPIGD